MRTTEFVASTDGRLRFVFLPRGSRPNCGADEWVWKNVKHDRTGVTTKDDLKTKQSFGDLVQIEIVWGERFPMHRREVACTGRCTICLGPGVIHLRSGNPISSSVLLDAPRWLTPARSRNGNSRTWKR
jgi:hypothetical protein